MWPEGLCQRKIVMTPSGIEPSTFRLVQQCLNQLRHRVLISVVVVPRFETGNFINKWRIMLPVLASCPIVRNLSEIAGLS